MSWLNPLTWLSKSPVAGQVNALTQGYGEPTVNVNQNGDKFFGGFGNTKLFDKDYWTLRQRSVQLFEENLYARGLIRRFITNEINTGLNLEVRPEESILGLDEDSLSDWSENIENRFSLWAKNAHLCDFNGQFSFGKIQAEIRREALISGDVLIIMRQSKRTKLPLISIVRGGSIQNPVMSNQKAHNGNRIVDGVELNTQNRHVAYWILQDDGKSKRLPAFGEKSGKKLAWLVYGTDKRTGEVRGTPLLALVLQSLKEIDRYRDAVQRKAVVNSTLAVWIKKGVNKMGTLPFGNGAAKNKTVTVDNGPTEGTKNVNMREFLPGMVFDELQEGEEPQGFGNQGIDEKFGEFEEAMIQGIAWANEIPPEILRLSFSSNYSASQAAINEYKMYLNRFRSEFGTEVCQPIYTEWFLSEVLNGKIPAQGFIESWRSAMQYDTTAAWLCTDWTGAIKPANDLTKTVKAYELMVTNQFITGTRAAREISGQKFTKIIKEQFKENELKAKVMRPLLELRREFGQQEVSTVEKDLEEEANGEV